MVKDGEDWHGLKNNEIEKFTDSLFTFEEHLWHSFQSDIFRGKKYENFSYVLWRLRGTT